MRCGETTDASTHDDQVVRFTSTSGFGCIVPEGAIADLVHGLESADMRSAQSDLGGRVISGSVLRFEVESRGGPHLGRNHRRASSDGNSVQEIAARNFRAHAKFLISLV